jgi:hypothetical protein
MAPRAKPRQPTPVPWWLAGEDEECRHCGQGYAHAAEVRCAECDDAACLLCMPCIDGRLLCPECAQERA